VLQHFGNAFEHAGELLNFGAFFAFTNVNLAAFWQFGFVRPNPSRIRTIVDSCLSLSGAASCAIIWWNLNSIAKIAGGAWFLIGVIYLAISTRGFRSAPRMIDFADHG
jgi:putrescine importer